jgi:hypothetical protein
MSSQCAPNHVLWLWVGDLRSRRAALHAAVARWSGTTAKYVKDAHLHSRGRDRVRTLPFDCRSGEQGRREDRVLVAPQPACSKKSRRQSPQVQPGHPAFPAQPNARDARETPLVWVQDTRIMPVIWGRPQAIFCKSEPAPLRQTGTKGTLRRARMRNLPVVQNQFYRHARRARRPLGQRVRLHLVIGACSTVDASAASSAWRLTPR